MADVFQMPVALSPDVLMIVETRKTRLRTRSASGNASHPHSIVI
jgi:hypothetical protein